MLLRRVLEHAKNENWFAVGVDFVIVVIGVFIGIQVANWNDVQNSKAGLATSLERLDREVVQNIAMIDEVLAGFEEGRGDLELSTNALNACASSPDAEAALERLLWDFVDDVQPNFASVALDQLARQDHYQALLSARFKDEFGIYFARLEEEDEQLTSHYDNLWAHHVNHHPDVGASFSSETENYSDWGFKLAKPLAEICGDTSFRNRFINTLGFYTSINHRLVRFRAEAVHFQKALAAERERG